LQLGDPSLRKHRSYSARWSAAAELEDGSRWIESLDFKALQTDANVVRDGKLAPAARRRWNYSPGCHGVQPPRRTSTRCQFEPVAVQVDVRWDDPFTTPIRR
jgi:hypothetical protein